MQEDRISRVMPIPLFPTWLFCLDHPNPEPLNDALRQLASAMRSADPGGKTVSNRGGWQSDDCHKREQVAPLIEFIHDTMQHIKKFLSASEKLPFHVDTCWFNINGLGARNTVHIHGNSYFSGVYYIDVPEGSGDIEFKDPNSYLRAAHSFEYERSDVKNSLQLTYSPVSGRLLIFPSYLPHEVLENHSQSERISVSFNVV